MKKNLPFEKKLLLLLSFLLANQLISQQLPTLLDPVQHPKFVNPLPFPEVLQPESGSLNNYKVVISQFSQDLGIVDITGNPLETTVWGYNGSYPGPTIEAMTDNPITVRWINELPAEHLFAIDKTIHWAGTDTEEEFNGIPTVTHLHGGHTDAESDGHPESWYTPGSMYRGPNYSGDEYHYENSQEAATLWYHDHTIGITRLNVYAGLGGLYLLRDEHENGLQLPKDEHVDLADETSPIEHFEIPLVIQDRVFDTNGQLVYPTQIFTGTNSDGSPLTINNSILPETFGEFILVNGKAWPYLEVQPRKYRLRMLNGSDSRFYDLKIPGVSFFQIGSDGGLLQAPLKRNNILIGPGERIDVIVDFSAPELWGQTLSMKNTARSPFPFGATANPQTSGQIMAFKVVKTLTNPDTSLIPSTLRAAPFAVSETTGLPRELVLLEQMDQFGRLLPSLGTAEKGALSFMDTITENPSLGSSEVWKIYNTTPDAHPIHLHLVHFQVINTQKFDLKRSFFGVNGTSSVKLLGKASPPAAENADRKDTFVVYPGEVATIKAHFDKEGKYVWHCHILSHEDHDMMRPFYVGNMDNSSITLLQTAVLPAGSMELFSVAPNPVLNQAEINFRMNRNIQVLLSVYDFSGRLVTTLYDGPATANEDYNVVFDRGGLSAGTYICKLKTIDGHSFEKLVMVF